MPHLNIEIKARCSEPDRVREILREHGADFRGVDHQIDTYFVVPAGRLKLREGNIENSLIFYDRPDQTGPKKALITMCQVPPDSGIKPVLTAAMGVRAVVDKHREIFFIDNVKFHIDRVEGLGSFVEIEAIDADGTIGQPRLQQQCERYLALLGIAPTDLIDRSYSDML